MGDAYSFVDYLNDVRRIRQIAATLEHIATDNVPVVGSQVAWNAAMKSLAEINTRMERFETFPPLRPFQENHTPSK